MSKIIFIVGLQKSGTTLVARLLSKLNGIENPFNLEGRFLWGDEPPFTPVKEPCGQLYQKHQGKVGHTLTVDDYLSKDKTLLQQRIKEQCINKKYWINKNPYNSVRLPWLKKHFPDSTIVAMIRNPVANVFSLLKKHHPHEFMGYPPENGWWGVKPANWLDIKNEDKLVQCAHQWLGTNKQMYRNKALIDHVIKYNDLCQNPVMHLAKLIELDSNNLSIIESVGSLTCNDNEYLTGSRFLSKNRAYKTQNNFKLDTQNDPIELPALNDDQVNVIHDICLPFWSSAD